jgi:hypothetical protein
MIEAQVEESLHLDYKDARALEKSDKARREIVKDVTAFANADGGVIIYGISEHRERANAHLPERLDPVSRAEISKEWLEHVIANAAPRVDGVIIHPVPLGNDSDRVAYVVEIPRSETAHQALDHRYYRRHNFESVPMEDYEIRDIMNRSSKPVLNVEARLTLKQPWEESFFLVRLSNTGKIMARHFACSVQLPVVLNGQSFLPADIDRATFDEVDPGCWAFCFTLGQGIGPSGSPLFPGADRILRFELKPGTIRNPTATPSAIIRLRAFADSNPPILREITPFDIDGRWG